MFKWFCLICRRIVWNQRTCECGNTMQQNIKIDKEGRTK